MKAFGYLLAGAALFSELALGLDPAPNANLPTGWRYKGCYTDKPWNYLTAPDPPNPIPPAVHGVPAWPRTLNAYYFKGTPNGGQKCVNQCVSLGFKFAATNKDLCFCDNAIAPNGTSTLITPYGVADATDALCQTPCTGNTGEACGYSPLLGNGHRLSLYEYIVSGFLRPNVCVVKLQLFFCVFLFRHRLGVPDADTNRIDREVDREKWDAERCEVWKRPGIKSYYVGSWLWELLQLESRELKTRRVWRC
ncbi:hypothetical protein IQ07DRAFT_676386 [Pyrenochaeta sp. DS3sAY3a]|nr:hypothetical protein IQ07DRAFT_676386 [Pyrenochaeta sp. DS3sAY3a]